MDADRFFTRVNPFVIAVARLPLLHRLVSPFLILVTVTGRRTGRCYTIPVGYQLFDDRIVTLVSKARRKNWWRNYLEPAPVELLMNRKSIAAEGVVVAADSAEFREYAKTTFRRLPWLGAQFGISYDRSGGLTESQLDHLGREAAIVRFTRTA